jgi:hypothetical protein
LKHDVLTEDITSSAAFKLAGSRVTEYSIARLPRVSGARTLAAFTELQQLLEKMDKYGKVSYLRTINPKAEGPLRDPTIAPLFTYFMLSQASDCLSVRSISDVRSHAVIANATLVLAKVHACSASNYADSSNH